MQLCTTFIIYTFIIYSCKYIEVFPIRVRRNVWIDLLVKCFRCFDPSAYPLLKHASDFAIVAPVYHGNAKDRAVELWQQRVELRSRY